MDNTDAPPRAGWRLRFSLRTLLCGVLLLGCAALTWLNGGPWFIDFVIQEPSVIYQSGFSPDGRFVYTVSKAPGVRVDTKYGFAKVVTFRDARSGAVRGSWRFEQALDNLHFESPDYFRLCVNSGKLQHYVYTHFESGVQTEQFPSAPTLPASISKFTMPKVVSHNGKWEATATFADTMAFPNLSFNQLILTEVATGVKVRADLTDNAMYIGGWICLFTPNDDRVIVSFDRSTFVVEIPTGKTLANWPFELCKGVDEMGLVSPDFEYLILAGSGRNGYSLVKRDDSTKITFLNGYPLGFSSDSRRVYSLDRRSVNAIDVGSGKLLWERSGFQSFSPDFEFFFADIPGKYIASICDGRTGTVLFEPKSWVAEQGFLTSRTQKTFGRSGQFLTSAFDYGKSEMYSCPNADGSIKNDDSHEDWKRVCVWSRRGLRGFVSMPEFWATVGFACALLWSLWRDRTCLRPQVVRSRDGIADHAPVAGGAR